MKIAFFSESDIDEAALKILVAGILKEEIEEIAIPNSLQTRGAASVSRNLPVIIRALQYNSLAEALVVVSDSDDRTVHVESHNKTPDDRCRLCELRNIVLHTLSKLNIPSDKKLKIAIGVPVPAIEAWFVCGKNGYASENTWIRKMSREPMRYDRRSLKEEVYGAGRPSKEHLDRMAKDSANRLISILDELEELFPQGFGTFASEIRSWRR
jgi:hypothetical protein